MYVIDMEDLEKEGVSLSQVQKSLEIECFNKIFHRSSDLPKKFKEKAFVVCKELTDTGLQSFITETTYSYTIWKEIKSLEEENNYQVFSEVKSEESLRAKDNEYNNYSTFVASQNQFNSSLIDKNKKNNDNAQISNQDKLEDTVNVATSIATKEIETEKTDEEFDDSLSLATSIATKEIEIEKSDEEFNDESEKIGKYRGLMVDKKTLFRISKAKKGVRTYRGVTY